MRRDHQHFPAASRASLEAAAFFAVPPRLLIAATVWENHPLLFLFYPFFFLALHFFTLLHRDSEAKLVMCGALERVLREERSTRDVFTEFCFLLSFVRRCVRTSEHACTRLPTNTHTARRG